MEPKSPRSEDSCEDEDGDYSKFQSRKKLDEIKKRRKLELEQYKKLETDVFDDKNEG